jgi:hypothetical protein
MLTLTKTKRHRNHLRTMMGAHNVELVLGQHAEVAPSVVVGGSARIAIDMSDFNFATKTTSVSVGRNDKNLQSIAKSALGADIQPTKFRYPQYTLSEEFVPENQLGLAIGEIRDTENGRVLWNCGTIRSVHLSIGIRSSRSPRATVRAVSDLRCMFGSWCRAVFLGELLRSARRHALRDNYPALVSGNGGASRRMAIRSVGYVGSMTVRARNL